MPQSWAVSSFVLFRQLHPLAHSETMLWSTQEGLMHIHFKKMLQVNGREKLVPENSRQWVNFSSFFINYICITLPNDNQKMICWSFCLFLIHVSGPRLFPLPWGLTWNIWLIWCFRKQNLNDPKMRLSHCKMMTFLMNQAAIQLPLFNHTWIYWFHKCLSCISYTQSTIPAADLYRQVY